MGFRYKSDYLPKKITLRAIISTLKPIMCIEHNGKVVREVEIGSLTIDPKSLVRLTATPLIELGYTADFYGMYADAGMVVLELYREV